MSNVVYKAGILNAILPVADMERSIAFYREVLDFEAVRKGGDHSVLRRDSASLNLVAAEDASVTKATRGHMSVYLKVNGIEALWAHVSQFKGRYEIRDLFDRDYGMREFHIGDPDGCMIFVGQPIDG